MSTRSVALENIIEILENGKPLHLVLKDSLDRHGDMDRTDRAFVSRLTRGVTERCLMLDSVIDRLASVKVKKQKPVIRNILRAGVYQILFMDSVSDFAACDESVKLAGKRGFRSLGGFVNGVLRNCCRRKNEFTGDAVSLDLSVLSDDLSKAPDVKKKFCYLYSMPEWLTDMWLECYGAERTKKAFDYFFSDNGISIRCNLTKLKPSELEQMLIDGNIGYTHGITKKCFRLENGGNPENISGFEQGLFTVQDESSVLAGLCTGLDRYTDSKDVCEEKGNTGSKALCKEKININSEDVCEEKGNTDSKALCKEKINIDSEDECKEKGNTGSKDSGICGRNDIKVLDLCAAPGGKSLHAADHVGVSVVACDISKNKTDMIREAAARCGFDNIAVKENDATVLNASFENQFDVVLCDLPCSGLGIIGKKPDIKYNMTPEKMKELTVLQRAILDNAVRYVKKDGILIYSTCTVNKEENEDNVKYIKDKYGFVTESLDDYLPKELLSEMTGGGMLQLLPGDYGCDGFFMARLKKIQE